MSEPAQQEQVTTAPKPTIKQLIRSALGYILPALIGMSLFLFVFKLAYVSGNSMNDTYQNADVLLCLRFGEIERGDIVICNIKNEKDLIKRVIGIEGDVIEIAEDGIVYLNGENLNEPYIKEPMNSIDEKIVFTVPEGSYFVMGDNRNYSHDSRADDISYIPKSEIIGKVLIEIT